jgi:hypothetical protein
MPLVKWLAVGLLSLVAGCSRPVSREELVGDYAVEYPFGKETLVLHADGTYVQKFRRSAGGTDAEAAGRWSFYNSSAAPSIALENPLLISNERGELRTNYVTSVAGLVVREVRKGQHILISANDDYGWYYRKLD